MPNVLTPSPPKGFPAGGEARSLLHHARAQRSRAHQAGDHDRPLPGLRRREGGRPRPRPLDRRHGRDHRPHGAGRSAHPDRRQSRGRHSDRTQPRDPAHPSPDRHPRRRPLGPRTRLHSPGHRDPAGDAVGQLRRAHARPREVGLPEGRRPRIHVPDRTRRTRLPLRRRGGGVGVGVPRRLPPGGVRPPRRVR